MQARLETAGKESAKPLALVYIMQTAMMATVPLLPTDEGFYADTDDDTTPPKWALIVHKRTRGRMCPQIVQPIAIRQAEPARRFFHPLPVAELTTDYVVASRPRKRVTG